VSGLGAETVLTAGVRSATFGFSHAIARTTPATNGRHCTLALSIYRFLPAAFRRGDDRTARLAGFFAAAFTCDAARFAATRTLPCFALGACLVATFAGFFPAVPFTALAGVFPAATAGLAAAPTTTGFVRGRPPFRAN
jgi:hypothetical protein